MEVSGGPSYLHTSTPLTRDHDGATSSERGARARVAVSRACLVLRGLFMSCEASHEIDAVRTTLSLPARCVCGDRLTNSTLDRITKTRPKITRASSETPWHHPSASSSSSLSPYATSDETTLGFCALAAAVSGAAALGAACSCAAAESLADGWSTSE